LARAQEALAGEREDNARLREVVQSQAGLHAAELAARDVALAERDRQIAELADQVSQLERKAGRDSSTSGKPPSSDSPYAKERKKPRDRSLREKRAASQASSPGRAGRRWSRSPTPTRSSSARRRAARAAGATFPTPPWRR